MFLPRHEIGRIISSPYLRARQTIEVFARSAGLGVELDDRLAERRLSPQPIEAWRDFVRRSFQEPDLSVPGGESGAETLARGFAAIRAALDPTRPLPVIVTHGQLLSLVLHSIDPSFGYEGWEALSNPDVHLIETTASGALKFRRIWS